MSNPILVYMTAGSTDEAQVLARTLVEHKLAACVNILPGMTSVYDWQGTIELDQEVVLLAKTVEANFNALCSLVTDIHSYEVPCIVALPITSGLPDYLSWARENLRLEKNQ